MPAPCRVAAVGEHQDERDDVQGRVAHPILLAIAREAEADRPDLGVRVFERPQALGAQVLLGLNYRSSELTLPTG